MISNAKKKLMTIAESLHRRVFGHEMSEEMRKFLGNLSWSFFGGIIASGVMLIVTILAGKKLGPEGFGQYNSLLSFATAMTFLFLLGNDTGSVRYLSDREHQNKKGEILTTSLIMVLMQALIFGLLLFLFFDFIKHKFSFDDSFLFLGLVFSLLLSLKSLLDGYLRSFHLIKKQSIVRIVDSLLVIVSFLFFYYYLGRTEYYFYAVSISIGVTTFIVLGFILISNNFAKFSFAQVKFLFNYNKFLIFGSIAGFVMSLERYFIGKYIGTYELGIYSAYYVASFLIISNLGGIFMNVFWPAAIKEKNNLKVILDKLNSLFLKSFPFWILFNSIFVFAVIFFMGKNYVFNSLYVILFPISSFVAFSFSTFISVLNIDRIKESVVISFFCYFILLILIATLQNIMYYLVGQIFIYLIFSWIVQKRLNISFMKI